MKKTIQLLLIIILILVVTFYYGNDFLILFESDHSSQSIGNVANGKLINGKRLPSSGDNFVTYSRLGSLIGRNGVHNMVRDVIIESFDALSTDYPDYKYVVGETSWLSGGSWSTLTNSAAPILCDLSTNRFTLPPMWCSYLWVSPIGRQPMRSLFKLSPELLSAAAGIRPPGCRSTPLNIFSSA